MRRRRSNALYFLTHANVVIDPEVPITDWGLSELGRARIQTGLKQLWLNDVTSLWSSTERKALDTAEILSEHLGLGVRVLEDLGENDRSATGYLPPEEFERTADRFFAEPDVPVRGWATARKEQARIVAASAAVAELDPAGVPLIVSHGAVGALLLAHRLGQPISRAFDQPRNGGGNWFRIAEGYLRWQSFDGAEPD
ncbi:phosphoglycerate mutase family protein [Nisaea acidiphila]|uniref:Phosphoglycerate mutase family protein n=1 Tax=Nisaea acidiphila TaxID=1862145 RepID=A0A9J7ATK5_9PROT|nr:histidine phosphatase family protein [Nisaea acidiphila]UUX49809.1 phosphoglycerate mutase family protein [Nisaea acidiphila]